MTKSELNIHSVDRLDRGLAYGEACFETFRVIHESVFGWPEHMARLARGLKAFGIKGSMVDYDALYEQILGRAIEHGDDTLVRVTVTGGDASWGLLRNKSLKPEIYIQCMPFKPQEQEIHLSPREWPFSLQMKLAKQTCDYALTLQAMNRWQQEGLKQGDTPLICKDGRMLSTPTANLLLNVDGNWVTPDAEGGGVLNGTIREALLKSGVVKVADSPQSWMDDCEAMAVTNSGWFIRMVSTVEGRALSHETGLFESLYQILRGKPGVPSL